MCKQYLPLLLMAMSSLNVFLMTSHVSIYFAQHMAEATLYFLHHLRQQYLGNVLPFVLREVSCTLLKPLLISQCG